MSSKDIREIERQCLESIKHSKQLPVLISVLTDEKAWKTRALALLVLSRIFTEYERQGRLLGSKEEVVEAGKKRERESAVNRLAEWLRLRRLETIEKALTIMGDGREPRLAVAALRALIRLCGTMEDDGKGGLLGSVDSELVWRVLLKFLEGCVCEESVLDCFREDFLEEFDDGRYRFLELVRDRASSVGADLVHVDTLVRVMLLVSLPTSEEEWGERQYLGRPDPVNAGTLRVQRRAVEDAWLGVMQLSMSVGTLEVVLNEFPKEILPMCPHPLRFADFLTVVYHRGIDLPLREEDASALIESSGLRKETSGGKDDGSLEASLEARVSLFAPCVVRDGRVVKDDGDEVDSGSGLTLCVLALRGIFVLMQHHGLVYPKFFHRLYALLRPGVMHLGRDGRGRFFKLLGLFLSSEGLSANLVAAFAKRLARLCLVSPPSSILFLIPLIFNLIRTHRVITPLIHRLERLPTMFSASDLSAIHDPFDPTVENPLKSGAIDSSLWEMVALRSHYHPMVAGRAAVFEKDLKRPTFEPSKFAKESYKSLHSNETKILLADEDEIVENPSKKDMKRRKFLRKQQQRQQDPAPLAVFPPHRISGGNQPVGPTTLHLETPEDRMAAWMLEDELEEEKDTPKKYLEEEQEEEEENDSSKKYLEEEQEEEEEEEENNSSKKYLEEEDDYVQEEIQDEPDTQQNPLDPTEIADDTLLRFLYQLSQTSEEETPATAAQCAIDQEKRLVDTVRALRRSQRNAAPLNIFDQVFSIA